MITKPELKPMRGYVEVKHSGQRMYRNVKTGEIVDPRAMASETDNNETPEEDTKTEVPE